MEKYENLGMIGEGSYGMVMKCRHKETRQLVAIKKFLETEDDKNVKKIALREVRMLKQVRHENLINLIEVFRRKKRLYLVFEFVDHTALDDLERYPTGAEENFVKKMLFQVLRGVEFCHARSIIHRDVKPENILISKRGVVKLCDFGFARTIAPPGETYTDYVATRWYRAPELLVGDTNYGRAIDIWAIGCLFSEMLTGEPLFPGESDIDQLYLITKCFGNLIARHREIFSRNPLFLGMRLPDARELEPLERRYPHLSPAIMDIVRWSLRLDPNDRPTCSQLLRHELFTKGGWSERFTSDLRGKVEHELEDNPLLKSLGNYAILQDAKNKTTSTSEGQSTMTNPPKRHARATLDGTNATTATTTTTTTTTTTDTSLSDAEALAAGRKEKKKKKSKNKDLLHHRDKVHPEKIKTTKQHPSHPPPPHLMASPLYATKLQPVGHTASHHSLTGSRSQLEPLPLRSIAPSGPGHEFLTHVIAPTPIITSPNLLGHTHSSNKSNLSRISPYPYPPTSIPNHTLSSSNSTQPIQRSKSIVNPPISVLSPGASILDGSSNRHMMAMGYEGSTTSLSNQQQGYLQSEHPSDVSLISERGTRYRPNKFSTMPDKLSEMLGITSPNHHALGVTSPNHYALTSPLGSPGAGGRHLGGGGGVSYKKQYAKNKETILLPQLKDSEFHHVKPGSTTAAHAASMFPISSGSQSSGLGVGSVGGLGMGNRGLLLGSINPHISSIESFRGAVNMRAPPTPPSHSQHASHQAIR